MPRKRSNARALITDEDRVPLTRRSIERLMQEQLLIEIQVQRLLWPAGIPPFTLDVEEC